MPEFFPPYLSSEVEVTDERYAHIVARHFDSEVEVTDERYAHIVARHFD